MYICLSVSMCVCVCMYEREGERERERECFQIKTKTLRDVQIQIKGHSTRLMLNTIWASADFFLGEGKIFQEGGAKTYFLDNKAKIKILLFLKKV